MRILLFLLVSLLSACTSPQRRAEKMPKPTSLYPDGWQPLEEDHFAANRKAAGDFNADGIPDVAIYVTDGKRTAFLVRISEGGQSTVYMLREDLEPQPKFDPVTRVLTLGFENGGSSGSDYLEAKFRYQNGDFFLIGTNRKIEITNATCAATNSCGYMRIEQDFVKGESVASSSSNGKKVTKVEKKKISATTLETMRNFKPEVYFRDL